jgi:hypothetical protein
MRPRRIIRFLHAFHRDEQPNSTEPVLRYLDGSLSEEDVERLDGRLKADPRLRKAFAMTLLNEEQLREIGRET